MPASERALVKKAGGLRKLLKEVNDAFAGTDALLAEAFDGPAPTKRVMQTSSPSSLPAPSQLQSLPPPLPSPPPALPADPPTSVQAMLGCSVVCLAAALGNATVQVAAICFAHGLLAGMRHFRSDRASSQLDSSDESEACQTLADATPPPVSMPPVSVPPPTPTDIASDAAAAVSDARYDAAVATAKGLEGIPNAQRLQIYALFKQAESGDAPTKAPSRLNAVAFAKWQAWDALRARPAARARADYVALIDQIAPGQSAQ